jgi:translation initiation factor 2B subunit (eIF-2B alpha/beta/delta family)
MQMNSRIKAEITRLKNDRVHGANWLSLKALKILKLAIQQTRAKSASTLIKELESLSHEISLARPGMVSISNYVSFFVNEIAACPDGKGNLEKFKPVALLKLMNLTRHVKDAPFKAANLASSLIEEEDSILICSYSSTIINLFKLALKKQIKFSITILESKFNGIDYSRISSMELRKYCIPSAIISKNKLSSVLKRSNVVFMGSDTILSDGSVVNGAPSLHLAGAAKKAGINLFVVGEVAKLDVGHSRKFPHLEPGFDLIPPELISGIVTEKGLLNPKNVSEMMQKGLTLYGTC